MSIVKGLIFIIFLVLFVKYKRLQTEYLQQREYFIKTLSHDLRVSTLAQIRGLEVLEKTQNRELIPEIQNSCKYTLDMMTMLLNTYRYENGEEVLTREHYNLTDSIKKCHDSISAQSESKNLRIYYKLESNVHINADKNALEKALKILMTTSVLNSQTNSNLLIKMKQSEEILTISIIYTGNPLTEEECKRMFSKNPRFSTVGHGIRMYLCKKIIDFHKGNITVKNKGKNINSFTITLPIDKNKKDSQRHTIQALHPLKM